MHKNLEATDRINIYFHMFVKLLRGSLIRLFLKEFHGIFLVGKGILHTEDILAVEKC